MRGIKGKRWINSQKRRYQSNATRVEHSYKRRLKVIDDLDGVDIAGIDDIDDYENIDGEMLTEEGHLIKNED